MWLFNFDKNSKQPKYKQIVYAIINSIEKNTLKKDDPLPSINELSFEYDIARDTVEKAYNELKEQGVIVSVRGKGFFINELKGSKLRVLLIFNKLSAYKKIIYYSFIKALGDKAIVDLQIHHYNAELLKKILEDSKGKYHYYVIMPHFYDGLAHVNVLELLAQIPKGELILLDKNLPELKRDYAAVYQDFENDIYDTLENASQLLSKYSELCLVFPESESHPVEIIKGFRKYCIQHQKKYYVVQNAVQMPLKKKTLYIVIEETDLANLIKKIFEKNYKLGVDVGIISFNETTLKEILAGGIATISTNFETMGDSAAKLILERQQIKIRNPFSLVKRSSV